MTEILLIMTAGVAAGMTLKKRQRIISAAEKFTMWAIYLLLFLLGLSVGTNEQVVNNFGIIGLKAVLLTLSGVACSVLLSFLLYFMMFRDKEDS